MKIVALAVLAATAAFACPEGGVSVQKRCWQLTEPGQSCAQLCGGEGAVDVRLPAY